MDSISLLFSSSPLFLLPSDPSLLPPPSSAIPHHYNSILIFLSLSLNDSSLLFSLSTLFLCHQLSISQSLFPSLSLSSFLSLNLLLLSLTLSLPCSGLLSLFLHLSSHLSTLSLPHLLGTLLPIISVSSCLSSLCPVYNGHNLPRCSKSMKNVRSSPTTVQPFNFTKSININLRILLIFACTTQIYICCMMTSKLLS